MQCARLAGMWLGSWPVQQDLRLLAPPAFTMEGLPAEPLGLLQLLTVTVRPLLGLSTFML